MRLDLVYPVTLSPASDFAPDETGFVVSCPDLPEVQTQGETEAEALANAADAIEEAIAGRIRHDEPIPEPSRPRKGQHSVAVAAQYAMKAALYLAMKEAKMTNVALAARLKRDEKDIRRLLDPGHASKLAGLEEALSAMGKRVRVVVEDAA